MKNSSRVYRLIGYALLIFITFMAVSLLSGALYVPIKQYLTGNPVDFSKHWEQADIARRVTLAVIFTIALTVYKYQREKKEAKNVD